MTNNVSVVGLGKLGSGLAAVIADAGIRVIGIDINESLIQLVNSGKSTEVEPELRDLMAKHGGKTLVATSSYQDAIDQSNITFVLVATPSDRHGHFSNGFLKRAMQSLAEALGGNSKPFHIFVVSSTVTPGSVQGDLIPLIERHSGRKLNVGFGVCYDPEFVALGAVVRGFKEPDVIIIGESLPAAGEAVAKIHQRICINRPVVRRMSITNAELAKASLNVFMTMKISFGNMLANLCERVPGADVDTIAEAIGHDKRIAPSYLKGGLAFGGPCFPRDTIALSAFMTKQGIEPVLINAVERVNQHQNQHLLECTLRAIKRGGYGAVGIMGLSFKPGTAVIAESPAIRLIQKLVEKGQSVVVYDPHALECSRSVLSNKVQYASSAEECVTRSCAVVIANREMEYKTAIESYRGPEHKVVVDCWRHIDQDSLAGNLEYIALGRGATSGMKTITRGNILGVGVSALNMDMAVGKIAEWIERREPKNVLAVPAHCIVECLRDEKLREIYNRAGMVTPDGMPIAWILKMMGHRHVDRVYGPDLMLALCKYGLDRGYRHFLYGGWPPSVVEQLAVKLREKFRGIQIVGTFAPPFRPLTPEEDQSVIEMINDVQPDIVWVGLGAAKEEFFSDTHVGKVAAPVLIGVGAAFDFHAGVKPQAPRWMMRSGLEWFFRMLTEPRRLGPRYLKDNPAFLWNVMLQALGLKAFRLENN